MPRPSRPAAALLTSTLLVLAGCAAAPEAPAAAPRERPALGLMTSLPLYWPLGAGIAELAAPDAPVPWQRGVLEAGHALVLLDTLTPVPGLTPEAPESDPLAGLERLAVIQPRGLSPADNVALDDWVRDGGRLLIALDPALTGDYDLPLGDPRRPVATALIPPVVKRWGLDVFSPVFEDPATMATASPLPSGGMVPLAAPGVIDIDRQGATRCTMMRGNALVTCRVGKGRVTLLADAAVFEHPELAGEAGTAIAMLFATAFD